jgi:hypothetical protein
MRLSTTLPAIIAGIWLSLAMSAAASPSDLAGVWWTRMYTPQLLPMDGTPLPFTPAGRLRYQEIAAGLKSGAVVDDATYVCLPEGMPRALTSAYPFQIMVTPDIVLFAHEVNRAYRTVNVTDRHADPDFWDPSYMGDGTGKWQGDTLVIDSTNFKADKIYLDSTGVPASEQLHLVERVRPIDGGKRLENLVTIDDPVIFTRPWTARLIFERRDDIHLQTEWICGQPRRDVTSVLKKVTR